jgi:type IV secretory pathway VirB2 component (pilin)
VGAIACLVPLTGWASPGNGPLVGFGQNILQFLTGILGPIVFGLGLAAAALSLIVGSREGLHRAFYAVLGGGILFSIGSIVRFAQSAAQ